MSARRQERRVPSSAWKEEASYHLLGLIASGAHCYATDPRLDYQCVDVTLVSGEVHPLALPRIDVQLKCSSSKFTARELASGGYALTLQADAYEEMRRARLVPLLLVLLILPPGEEAVRLTQGESGCAASPHLLLWSDPALWPPLEAGQQSKTVVFLRENEFTSAFLESRMKEIGNGGAR